MATEKTTEAKNNGKNTASRNDGWDTHRPTRALKDGESCEGFYLGRTEIVGKWGARNVHHFHDTHGVTFSIYGGAIADKLLSGVPRGTMTRLRRIGNVEDSQAVEYELMTNKSVRAPNDIDGMFVGL